MIGCLMMSTNCVTYQYVILYILLLSLPWDKAVFLNTLFSGSLGLTFMLCMPMCVVKSTEVIIIALTTLLGFASYSGALRMATCSSHIGHHQ
jgi:fatty-acid desaturase